MHHKHAHCRSAAATTALLVTLAGCADADPTGPNARPQRVIFDGLHGAPVTFYFIPQDGWIPVSSGLAFDARLEPTIVICELTGTSCSTTIATITNATDPREGSWSVHASDQTYRVRFMANLFGLTSDEQYRMEVRVGGVLAGYADVLLWLRRSQLAAIDNTQFFIFQERRPWYFEFRFEYDPNAACLICVPN